VLLGYADERVFVGIAAPIVALVFAAATGVLLVADLKQPKRFYFIFTRPQWGSWLVRGAFILLGHGLLSSLWLLGGLLNSPALIKVVAAPAVLFAAGTAGYTAFLFGQCEGRDFWQTPLLLPVLLAQAGVGGAGLALFLAPMFNLANGVEKGLRWLLLGSLLALGFLIWTELASKGTVHVEMAQRSMTHGLYKTRFRIGVGVGILLAGVLAVVATATSSAALGLVAGIAGIVGLVFYEDAFVRAGQSVPLS
jgi:formate-dependent nitrite reductase membrane component NrfD